MDESEKNYRQVEVVACEPTRDFLEKVVCIAQKYNPILCTNFDTRGRLTEENSVYFVYGGEEQAKKFKSELIDNIEAGTLKIEGIWVREISQSAFEKILAGSEKLLN